jgi:hypothetical protein
MSVQIAPRNGQQAADFLRTQHERGSNWPSLCLSLQRQARGLPGVYPSALSAALATPKSERVTKISGLKRGMVAYCDDPNDSNPYGHIFFIVGWNGPKTSANSVLTWSNVAGGEVEMVRMTHFTEGWGDNFQFGATWLNGYDFADFNAKPKPRHPKLGDNYMHAIEDIEKALRFHKQKGHDGIAKMLRHDLERMNRKLKRVN